MRKLAFGATVLLLFSIPNMLAASDFTMSTIIARVVGVSKTVDENSGAVVRSTVTQRKQTFNEATQTIETEDFTTECPGDRCFRTEFMTCPYLAHVLVIDNPEAPQTVTGLHCVSTTAGSCGQVNGMIREESGFLSLTDGILYSSRGCG